MRTRVLNPVHRYSERSGFDAARFSHLKAFFDGLELNGLLRFLDRLWIPGIALREDTLGVDLLNPDGPSWTLYGAYTFTASRGIAFDGSTGYADTGWVPGRDNRRFNQDDASFGVYINAGTDAASDSVRICGATSLGSISPRSSAGTMRGTMCDNTIGNFTGGAGVSTRQGLTCLERTGASSIAAYRNGSANGTGTTASVVLTAGRPLFAGAMNSSGTASSFSDNRIAMLYAGRALGSSGHSTFYTLVQALLTAVGAHV